MHEAQHVGVEAETVQRIVAVAIFRVAADRMSHVRRVNTNLVLTTRLQLIFHQRVLGSPCQHMEVRHSQLAAIVSRRRVSDVCLVVLQPVTDGAVVVLHLAAHHSHVAAVIHRSVPVMLDRKSVV